MAEQADVNPKTQADAFLPPQKPLSPDFVAKESYRPPQVEASPTEEEWHARLQDLLRSHFRTPVPAAATIPMPVGPSIPVNRPTATVGPPTDWSELYEAMDDMKSKLDKLRTVTRGAGERLVNSY